MGRAYPGDRALEKDSGFREPRFQETRKSKGSDSPGPLWKGSQRRGQKTKVLVHRLGNLRVG